MGKENGRISNVREFCPCSFKVSAFQCKVLKSVVNCQSARIESACMFEINAKSNFFFAAKYHQPPSVHMSQPNGGGYVE